MYYYFYERGRSIIVKSRPGSKALSTPESMLIGLVAGKCSPSIIPMEFYIHLLVGSATAIISNPIWVVQTNQAVQSGSSSSSSSDPKPKKLGILETIQFILRKGGISAFWRGIGPALILVANPVLQYTFFEQLKNYLVLRRTERLRASGRKGVTATLSGLDYFFLGALSKLCESSWCDF